MASSRIQTLDDFIKVHSILLVASGIPPSLYGKLFEKLFAETFDGGDFFSVEPCEGGRQRSLILSAESMAKESDIFLVDHAWTFRLQDALKKLKEVPGLVQRMAALMCVDLDLESDSIEGEFDTDGKHENGNSNVWEILQLEMSKLKERGGDAATWLELEELGIDDEMLCSLDLSSKFPDEAEAMIKNMQLR